jgi:(p)ppGpp synthase/HD superfamily hydrolase
MDIFQNYQRYSIGTPKTFAEAVALLPPQWGGRCAITKALGVAAIGHARQVRRSNQLPTIVDHIIPVGVLAYDQGVILGWQPHRIDKAVAIALLHDVVEDAPKNGQSSKHMAEVVRDMFGEVIATQVDLLSVVDPGRKLSDAEKTLIWLRNLSQMEPETRIVKAADVYSNTDGEPLREDKYAQRLQILTALEPDAPLLVRHALTDLHACPIL